MRTHSAGVHKVFGAAPKKAPARSVGGIRPALFYSLFAGLLATNVLTLVGFLMAPDISALLSGQNDQVFAAYEDRIAQLRVEVDRLHSRQFAQAGDINLQLQELTQQQEVLLEQHQLVKQLAQKAAEMGIDTSTTASAAADDDEAPTAPIATVAPASATSEDLAAVSSSMVQMMDDSRMALAALSGSATESTTTILDALKGIGIRPSMPDDSDLGVGGPLLPPTTDGLDSTGIVDDANAAYLALARFKAARTAIDLAPVHKPMGALTRVSSTYGNRKDPFTGGRAFHAGIDFPAPKGTTVLSAGYGKVTFVGEKSGYGNLVEVTHGTGLVTRYGHLSAFLVTEGQIVATGTPIARVGSTGRSTGPHLHFEVRLRDVAVDPGKYLAVGKRLARFLGA
ncbi:M23 family metallopeptidase [Devosia sp.]|uniref:M23 family metallopeptidase n=1 Tax=Devosia sp. TaxID=1871048 RepID=UPI001AC1AF1A|nr:M23 family metallopeptidase [Devosia sp.]MBN9309952.1 M23 family metallopeptidase [Devosia sp.]